jgi:hypothetical protein
MVRLPGSLAVVACWCALAAAQPPETRQEAAEHFKLAKAAEKDGRHQEAIDEYLLAYTLVPHADVLYNIAFNYESLKQWSRAVEYYQRYLDERPDRPVDADAVIVKIKDLKTRIPAPPPRSPPPAPRDERPAPPVPVRPETAAAAPPADGSVTGTGDVVPPPPGPPAMSWHGGLTYGVGFGDTPVDRYLAHGGVRILERIDLDAVIGGFGKNDRGLGVLTRIVVARSAAAQPFLRGALTVGYAPQDDSSTAETKFPIGVEAGAGLQLGGRWKFEIDAVARWTIGGWDAASTGADSYVADAFAFAIDLGIVADFGIMAGGR